MTPTYWPKDSGCKACITKTRHTPEDWKNHPLATHGYVKETGWTLPSLKPKDDKCQTNT